MKSISNCLKMFYKIVILLFLVTHLYAQSKENVLPTGKLFDAGGHKLHMNIMGEGYPTAILENGSGDFSFIWSLVQPEVAKFTKVVSYDRAGYAWSEPGPTPRTSRQICLELHTALHNAGIKEPYILVGQSFGGFIVRAFARYYPNEVGGMVLVEAVQENERIFMGGDKPQRIRDFAAGRTEPSVQTFFKPVPVITKQNVKLDSGIEAPFDRLSDNIQRLQIWAQSQDAYRSAAGGEMDWSPEDVANLYNHKGESSYMLGNIPLIVLTRGKGGYDGRSDSAELEDDRLTLQNELAHLSTNSKHIIDKNSGHNIHLEDPITVINAIRDVFIAAKEQKLLK